MSLTRLHSNGVHETHRSSSPSLHFHRDISLPKPRFVSIRYFDYPILINLADAFLSLYFITFCDLRPITVDLNDGETTVHFWVSGHRRNNRPDLVMLHGYGGNSKWQFIHQVSDLSKSFNLFIPDLVFFGKSHSRNTERTVEFQARSVVGGLKRLGCSEGGLAVYSISYGGFVAYRIAKMWPEMIERLVDREQWSGVMYETNRKELVELAKNLLEREEDAEFYAISQKTLIIWGDKDEVFPLEHGRRLHRHLPNSSIEILKDIGHGVNIEAPTTLNNLITSFVLDVS
ncbi:hypothetical protein F2Q69_00050505 [Brassica cretica]|uniref:AB hydrolase-1 domain-containing protein n=1 Tax=Brassica cretica TaxID=69181 RepID=A0A8S9PI16_BRACR|nr:hypothetical protein F2Q69_00050505 [Brassica cretica]